MCFAPDGETPAVQNSGGRERETFALAEKRGMVGANASRSRDRFFEAPEGVELFTPASGAYGERDVPVCLGPGGFNVPASNLASIAFRFANRAGIPVRPSVMRNGESVRQTSSPPD